MPSAVEQNGRVGEVEITFLPWQSEHVPFDKPSQIQLTNGKLGSSYIALNLFFISPPNA